MELVRASWGQGRRVSTTLDWTEVGSLRLREARWFSKGQGQNHEADDETNSLLTFALTGTEVAASSPFCKREAVSRCIHIACRWSLCPDALPSP